MDIVKSDENIFDVAVRLYGRVDAVFQLAKLNGIGMTDNLAPGASIKTDDSLKFDNIETAVINVPAVIPYKKILSRPLQNVFDLAIQLYGDLGGVFNIASQNSISVTDNINPATEIIAEKPINKLITDFFSGKNLYPASGIAPEETQEILPSGIGYWAIEIDFKVS